MNDSHRLSTLSNLRDLIGDARENRLDELCDQAYNENNWFTSESIAKSLDGILHMLEPEKTREWLSNYAVTSTPKQVGMIMAGNIPLVGFHDLMCVLMSGHFAAVKMSSKDSFLMKEMIRWISQADLDIGSKISVRENLKDIDAIIATGSNNSARYFEYYFSKYPHIIRKNRSSVAILDRKESSEDLKKLGNDVFDYFGLGCRNVSMIFIPEGYDLTHLLDSWSSFENVLDHHKYRNNYDYQKSILLVNKAPHLDSGFVLMTDQSGWVSPISVVHYQYYKQTEDLSSMLEAGKDQIQCVVGRHELAQIPFGNSQTPELWDYADNIDTMSFLSTL